MKYSLLKLGFFFGLFIAIMSTAWAGANQRESEKGLQQKQDSLPSYVILDNPHDKRSAILRKQAQRLTFPLSKEDQDVVEVLTQKFDQEENCAGLAAPQIGYAKPIIIFAVDDEPEIKKWRPDLVQTMPKTVWINPSYTPIGNEKHTDFEACFSVEDKAGPVARFKTIRYQAFTPQGEPVTGIAKGFLARLIQHEIDHVNGKCFVDYVAPGELLSPEEYREKRRRAMESTSKSLENQ